MEKESLECTETIESTASSHCTSWKISQEEARERILIMNANEDKMRVDCNYIEKTQRDGMTANFRRRITEWMLALKLTGETVATAQNVFDRYLSTVSLDRTQTKLVAMTSIFSASKIHETHPLRMGDLLALGNNLFSAKQISAQEKRTVQTLQWKLIPVTAYEVMSHLIIFAELDADVQSEVMAHAQAVIDFALCEYNLLKYGPSAMALGSVQCAFRILKSRGDHVMVWAQGMAKLGVDVSTPQMKACVDELQAVFDMYCPPEEVDMQHGPAICQDTHHGQSGASPTSVSDLVQTEEHLSRKRPSCGPSNPTDIPTQPAQFHPCCTSPEAGPAVKKPRAVY